ncbi:hypothetical protein, partial [Photobacterium sp. BZF1]|uniref:hypothetical protein n=1 Tax=Photobacterium sp. BZF1 TaxID=1904457 RepID=UPI001CA3FF73
MNIFLKVYIALAVFCFTKPLGVGLETDIQPFFLFISIIIFAFAHLYYGKIYKQFILLYSLVFVCMLLILVSIDDVW